MKFYNPFKWHIVEFNDGKFGVRRRSFWLFRYGFCDAYAKERYFLQPEFFVRWCVFDNIEVARNVLNLKLSGYIVKRVVE